jgi:outer membrane protein assembly factor BamB
VISRTTDRRKLIVGAAGSVAAAAMLGSDLTLAQENGPGATPMPVGPAVPPEFTSSETNWPVEGGNLKATRQAVGSSMSSSTIGELGVGWRVPVPASAFFGSLTSNPVIVDGVVFVQDATSNVYAWEASTGEAIWKREYNLPVPSGGPNGIAVAYGNAYFPVGSEGMVVAVRADTGEDVWQTSIQGPLREGITMAPLVYDNTVYISTIPGHDTGFYLGGQRGVIHALDASNGTVLWYFDTTTDNLWDNARINSGGGLWHPPSVDDAGNLYVGIGNAGPYPGLPGFPSGSSRPGDNDYANALMRINPDSASVDWFINIKPFDLFDLDTQLTPILTTISLDGVETLIAIATGKHGIVVAANAETGEELWRTPVGKHLNDDATEIPANGTLEVLPGYLGGVETPIAYSEGVVYLPLLNMSSIYTPDGISPDTPGFETMTGQMVALSATDGTVLWDVEVPTGLLAGATVANDLVFTGGLDGVVRAFNTTDGAEVWTYQASAGMNAPFAISGDWLFVPAGGPLIASSDTADPAPTLAQEFIAFTLGGSTETATTASPESASAAAAESGSEMTVTAIDIEFVETELSIPADTDVVVTVKNDGALQHDFVIAELNIQSPLLNSGESAQVTINAPAGEYEYICSVPGHAQAGMIGILTVS